MKKSDLAFAGSVFLASIILALLFTACPSENDDPPPVDNRFTVSVGTILNGSVNVTPEGPFERNTIVTLEPVPNQDFMFSAWNIQPSLQLTQLGDGKVSFSMPNRGVVVGATFIHRNQFPFSITVGTPVNGTLAINPTGPQVQGTRINLTATPANDNYRLDGWVTVPASLQVNEDNGQHYFLMVAEPVTINATFTEDTRTPITSGTITLGVPSVGDTAPVVGSTVAVTAGNFTAELLRIDGPGVLGGNRTFNRHSVYNYVITLTPTAGNRLVSTTDITAQNSAGNIQFETDFGFVFGAHTATLTVTLPRTTARPADPAAIDIAYGRGAFAVRCCLNTANATAHERMPFVGTSHLLSDTYAVWQAGGSNLPHWVSVDLGAVYDLSTVVITWGAGAGNLWDGFVAGVIQVADEEPNPLVTPPPAPGEDFFNEDQEWNSIGNYSDWGWTTVGTFRNIGRGEVTPGVMETNLPDPLPNPYVLHRDTNAWANFIRLDPGTRGRFIRVKVDYPWVNPGNATAAFGAWTSWPRVSMFEVYQEELTVLEPGEVEFVNPNPGRPPEGNP